MCFSWMGYCFHHCLPMTSKDTLWIFPEDESVVCFQMTVKHSESACFRSRPVIMLPWREIVRWLKKVLGKKKKKVACITWDHIKQNFCSLDGGCITWKTRAHFQGAGSFHSRVQVKEAQPGWRFRGTGGEHGCVREDGTTGWDMIITPCRCSAAVRYSPGSGHCSSRVLEHSDLRASFWHSYWKAERTALLAPRKWVRKSGNLQDDQASMGEKKQGKLINWLIISALVLFSHFKWVFQKAKTVKVTDF